MVTRCIAIYQKSPNFLWLILDFILLVIDLFSLWHRSCKISTIFPSSSFVFILEIISKKKHFLLPQLAFLGFEFLVSILSVVALLNVLFMKRFGSLCSTANTDSDSTLEITHIVNSIVVYIYVGCACMNFYTQFQYFCSYHKLQRIV